MSDLKRLIRVLIGVCLVVVAACGGGGNNNRPIIVPPVIPPPAATEPVSALGAISALGSATVNGVRFNTDAATVAINGEPGSFSDLKLGQIVSLDGRIEVLNPRGTASRIDYDATVIGPVESIEAALGQLVVMGQTVLSDSDTVFDPNIDPGTFAGLSVGSIVEVSGFLDAAGQLLATRIEPNATALEAQLIGRVTGLDLANMLFNVNRLTVDYSSAAVIDLPGGMPAEGLFLLVRGQLADGILIVDELLSLYDTGGGTAGERAQAQGLITSFTSPTDFALNGFPVTTDGTTAYLNGTINDLQPNAQITIDGEIAVGGDRLLANEIAFGRVLNPTTTLSFPLDSFTDISVSSVFQVTVTESADFLVEVTIDADDANRVDVTRTGATLNIGLLPASGNDNIQTIQAVVTMPRLDSVTTTGVIDVVLSDFNQPLLTANIGGVSRLRSSSLLVGDLTASVSGVSQIDFANIRPLGSANITVSGVSTATLNMDVGSALTGSVTGVSSLFYYGTNVAVNVTTDPISTLRKLGETRP